MAVERGSTRGRAPRNLKLAQAASAAGWAGEWCFTTALAIYAFHVGGAAAVALVGVLRMLPAALAGPLAGTIIDRFRRERVIFAACAARAALTAAGAVALGSGAPPGVVYALAVGSTVAFMVFRPSLAALLPLLCRDPQDLTAANVTNSMLEALSTLIGPLAAGALVAATAPEAAFAAAALAFSGAAAAAALVRYEAPPANRPPARTRRTLAEGVLALGRARDARLVVGLMASQAAVRGALNVFIVALALGLLDLGDTGVGALNAIVGAGGLAAALGSTLLRHPGGLARNFALGLAVWGAPIALLGGWTTTGAAFAAFLLVGVGNTLVDVAGYTLLSRITPEAVLGRVFGVLEGLIMLAVSLGSVVTAVAIDELGIEGSLGVIGSVLPVLAVLAWPRLRRLSATLAERDGDITLLRGVPMLARLPLTTLEDLARDVHRVAVPAGQHVFRQGDPGDRFYVIAAGEAEVLGDNRRVRTIAAGEAFGEIALLRDVPRTAGVRALEPLSLLVVDRERFVSAVSGYTESSHTADAVVGAHLATFRPRIASL